MSVLTALEQLSRCSSEESFLAAVESALFGRHIRRDELDALRLRAGQNFGAVLAFANGRSESGLETITRWRLHRAGIACRQQVDLPLVGRVDLVVGDRLIIELDGREHHSGDVAFGTDRRRDAAAAAQGFRTLRFSYAQVVHDWPSVEAAVLAVVDEGSHETAAGRRHRADSGSPR